MPDNQGHLRALERFLCGLPNRILHYPVAESNSNTSIQPSKQIETIFDLRACLAGRDYQLPLRKTEVEWPELAQMM